MPRSWTLRAALLAWTFGVCACGGHEHFDPSDYLAGGAGSLSYAVSIDDGEGRTHGHERALALALPGCAEPCVRLKQERAALPLTCAPTGATLQLHDDEGQCRSPIGYCQVLGDVLAAASVRCVVSPASVEFVVELR